MTERRAYNYDIQTGQEVTLKDLFKADYAYKATINDAIKQSISSRPDVFFDGDSGFKGISDTQSYYLQDNRLIIYFPLYEIAPYASGIPEFNIALNRFGGGLK